MGRQLTAGVVGGLVGGLLLALVVQVAGAIERVGMIIGMEDPVAGWAILLVVGLVLGLLYVPTVGRLRHAWGTGALYGLAYGAVWWVLGTLIIMPPLVGQPMFAVGPATWVNLVGYLLYGLALGLVYAGMAGRQPAPGAAAE
jgi:hypothetical protein